MTLRGRPGRAVPSARRTGRFSPGGQAPANRCLDRTEAREETAGRLYWVTHPTINCTVTEGQHGARGPNTTQQERQAASRYCLTVRVPRPCPTHAETAEQLPSALPPPSTCHRAYPTRS